MTKNPPPKPSAKALAATDAEAPVAHPAPSCAVVTQRIGADGATLAVHRQGQAQDIEASVAASCLLRPEVGDVVLVCPVEAPGNQPPGWWVLAVLRRAQAGAATLRVPGATAVTMSAPELHLRAEDAMTLASAGLRVEARRVDLRGSVLQATADTVGAVARKLTLVADKLDTLARDVVLRSRHRVSKIDEVDSLQAGNLSIQVEETAIAEGGQVVINARDNVRIDGQRILMG